MSECTCRAGSKTGDYQHSDYCPVRKDERIAELEAELAALREALTSISTALDAYGVRWCRDAAKDALLQEPST